MTAIPAKPIFRPADMRRAVSEWVSQGFSVEIKPNGAILVLPAAVEASGDQFDMVDFKR